MKGINGRDVRRLKPVIMDMNDIHISGDLVRPVTVAAQGEDPCKRARRTTRRQDSDLVAHPVQLPAQPPDDPLRSPVPGGGYDVIEYLQDVHT